ncbi:heme biosynthesis protein HemY [Haloferula helveola]|uniref:Heme biosynthesis protein HemY n=1 Tax=Haloferula helveola TaxID=490095 RepID=A0ABM7RG48_9BACT|nr:heme biosynthesis protein HemY [Haloferula helveola]
MIRISDPAAKALRQLLESKGAGPDEGLRLAVRKGGCAGWQYEMGIGEAEDGDRISEFEGGRVIVAADSVDRLDGCEVDYVDSLSDAGFRINNPRAARSCGCGTSFEDAGEPPLDPSEIEECGN